MQKILSFLAALLFCCCSADNEVIAQTTMDKIYITIGGQTQSVTLVDNDATRELVAALQNAPITVTLNDNNFEIWGSSESELRTFLKAGQNNIIVTLSLTETTGINTVKSDKLKDKSCYTLQGTLAQAGHKGIIIQNGKKIIRKQ